MFTQQEIDELLSDKENAAQEIDAQQKANTTSRTELEQDAPLYKGIAAAGKGFAQLIKGAPTVGFDSVGESVDSHAKFAQGLRDDRNKGFEIDRKASERPLNSVRDRLMATKASAETSLIPKETELSEQKTQSELDTLPGKTELTIGKNSLGLAQTKSEMNDYDPNSVKSKVQLKQQNSVLSQIANNKNSKNSQVAKTLLSDQEFQQLPPAERNDIMKDISAAEKKNTQFEFKTATTAGETIYGAFNPDTGKYTQQGQLDGQIKEQRGRSGASIQQDILRKDYEKEYDSDVREPMSAVAKTRQMFEIAKTNPEAVGVLQYNIARSIAGEKGPLSKDDVQTAAVTSPKVVDSIIQTLSLKGFGALTTGQKVTLEKLLVASEDYMKNKGAEVKGRYKLRADQVGANMEFITGEKEQPLVKQTSSVAPSGRKKLNSADELP